MSGKEIIHDLKVSQILDEEDLKYLWEKKRNFLGVFLQTYIAQWISFLDRGEGVKNKIDKAIKDGGGKPRKEYFNILDNIEMLKSKKLTFDDVMKVFPLTDDQIDEILVVLFDPKYNPPHSPFEIINHLTVFFRFYGTNPSSFYAHYMLYTDFNMAKLTYQAAMAREAIFDWEKTQIRTLKSTEGRNRSVVPMKKLVWETYQNMVREYKSIPEDFESMNPSRKAKIIEKKLGISSPHPNTIKKYLREYNKIKSQSQLKEKVNRM